MIRVKTNESLDVKGGRTDSSSDLMISD